MAAGSKNLLGAKPGSGVAHAPADARDLGPNTGDTPVAAYYYGSPRRLVCDVLCTNTTTVQLYRYDRQFQDWVPLADGAQNVTANVVAETRWQTNGIESWYVLVAAAGTGTWQPIPAVWGP